MVIVVDNRGNAAQDWILIRSVININILFNPAKELRYDMTCERGDNVRFRVLLCFTTFAERLWGLEVLGKKHKT